MLGGGYGQEYSRLLAGQLDSTDWKPVVSFYTDLRRLADSVGARLFVVIMPVNGIIASHDPRAQTYPQLARKTLEAEGIPWVDGFAVLRARGLNIRDAFLPMGPDSHPTPATYRAIAQTLADSLSHDPATAALLSRGVR